MSQLKKFTQRDRYGNQTTYEFESPVKPVDQTALMKAAMEQMEGGAGVPQMASMGIPQAPMQAPGAQQQSPAQGHPGAPQGSDTVPAWLTPGEFVMNAEATRMFPEQIEQMNNQGREVQASQGGSIPEMPQGYARGGMIPQYHANGGAAYSGKTQQELVDEALALGATPEQIESVADGLGVTEVPITQGQHIPQGGEFDNQPVPELLKRPEEPYAAFAPELQEDYLNNPQGLKPEPQPEAVPYGEGPDKYGKNSANPIVRGISNFSFGSDAIDSQANKWREEQRTPSPEFIEKHGDPRLDTSGNSVAVDGEGVSADGVPKDLGAPPPSEESQIGDIETLEARGGINNLREAVSKTTLNDPAFKTTEFDMPEGMQDAAANADKEDPSLLNKIWSGLKGAFQDEFGENGLYEAAVYYLGSRALGYDHSDSLRGLENAYHTKAKRKYESGVATAKGEADLNKAKKLAKYKHDLEGKGGAETSIDLQDPVAYGNGAGFAVKQKVKVGNNTVERYVDKATGKPVDATHIDDQRFVGGSEENLAYHTKLSADVGPLSKEIFEEHGRTRVDGYGEDGHWQANSTLTQSEIESTYVDWAMRNKVTDPRNLKKIYGKALKDYYKDAKYAKSQGQNVNNFEGYINNQFIRSVGGDRVANALTVPNPKGGARVVADAHKVTEITRTISRSAGSIPGFADELKEYGDAQLGLLHTAVMEDMLDTYRDKVSPKDKKFYQGAAGDKETAEMVYMRIQLGIFPYGNVKTRPTLYYNN